MNGKEKHKPQDDYSIMPDEELLERFRHDRKRLKLIALPLAAYVMLFAEFASTMFSSNSGIGMISYYIAAGFVCYTGILFENVEKQKKFVWIMDVVQILLLVIGFFSGNPVTPLVGFLFAGIANLANLCASKYINDIDVLKKHPRFPFDNWRRDETYLNRASRSDAIKYIENTDKRGSVQAGIGEEFLSGELTRFEKPKPDPEKNFQQRRQNWRSHDKAETGYALDNIKNMYFDAPDEGELSGKELERELMKATAPKKAPEPIPEEFFQSSPVIYRTNKDGSATIERREPGSKPAGEFDSRSVLM